MKNLKLNILFAFVVSSCIARVKCDATESEVQRRFSSCPRSWVRRGRSLYLFSRSGLSWPDAMRMCNILNGHLVDVKNSRELRFLKKKVGQCGVRGWWVGATDVESEMSFIWVKTRKPLIGNWARRQPDNGRGNENCVEIWRNGKYNDDQCYNRNHYICEKRKKRNF